MDERRVVKVTIADLGSRSGRGTEMDQTAPFVLLVEFIANYVTFLLSDNDPRMYNSVGLNPTRTNALQVLMRASRDQSHLPSTIAASEHRPLIATVRLYNRVIA